MLTEVSLDKCQCVVSDSRRLLKTFAFSGDCLAAASDALDIGSEYRLEDGWRVACVCGTETVSLVAIQ